MEWLKQLLGDELYNQVIGKLGDTKIIKDDGNFIPKSRFDEVNQQKNNFKTQNDELNTQLEALKKSNKGNEELTKQITELQGKLQDAETKNKDISITSAIKMAAIKANAVDPDVVSMLIDKAKVITNEDGSIKEGLEEQIKNLAQSKTYLFGETVPGGGGGNPAGGGGNLPKDPNDMTMEEYAAWYKKRNENN
ncbi:MAG: hypothetical protein K0R54_5306 [Clostridiaceae bacterium]|jgi:hypothetical protein|nr:hypothetical protein [Clostridiaceae bacterium]